MKQLHAQILVGLVLGLLVALGMRAAALVEPPSPGPEPQVVAQAHDYALAVMRLDAWRQPFVFVGDLFLRLLKLLVVPLIVLSILSGIQQIGSATALGRVGWRTLAYYLVTTLIAVVLGLVMVNIVQPGVGLNLVVDGAAELTPAPILHILRDIIPTNFLEAMATSNMLPTIFVSIVFGMALLVVGEAAKPAVAVIDALNAAMFKVVDWVMATAPVGVAALLVATIADPALADVASFFTSLGGYMFTVLIGLLIHACVLLPLLLWVTTKRNPLEYIRALSPALLTAFSTASSSATYPVTRDCVVNNAKVDRASADFVLPLGATVNMDGTALYEAVAAVFIANAIGIDLTFADQVVIVLTATLASIGAAGVPSAGLVTMIIVLESVGLPAAGYVLIVPVDRLLDMCRTTVNIWGDAVGAAIIDRWMNPQPE